MNPHVIQFSTKYVLPTPIAQLAFSFCNLKTLLLCKAVSKGWQRIAQSICTSYKYCTLSITCTAPALHDFVCKQQGNELVVLDALRFTKEETLHHHQRDYHDECQGIYELVFCKEYVHAENEKHRTCLILMVNKSWVCKQQFFLLFRTATC